MRYPFKFLDAYGKDDTDIFFGRKDDVEKLYNMLFETNMVWLYGASGTGKTSLIQCGLANKFNPYDWYDIRIKRGKNLIESFQKALDDAGGSENSDSDEIDKLDELLEQLELKKLTTNGETIPETKPLITENAIRLGNIYQKHFKPIYLIFDQFEELFILGTDAETEAFLEILIDLLHVEWPVKMIFSIRSEFMFHLGKFEKHVPSLLHRKLELEPMDINKVKEVLLEIDNAQNLNVKIDGATTQAKGNVIEDIFEKVKDKAQDRTVQLPYLQVFLDNLYMRITDDPDQKTLALFTVEKVRDMGNIGNVLSELLAKLVVDITLQLKKQFPAKTIEEKKIWSVLSPFVTVDKTKSPISKATVYQRVLNTDEGVIDSVIAQLITGKVLRYVPETKLHELVHDSLCELIAERRDQDEKNLLRAKELIKYQLSLYREAEVLISATVMNIIEPYILVLMDQKQLSDDEIKLLDKSWDNIKLDWNEKERERKKELHDARKDFERSQMLRKRGKLIIGIAVTAAIILTGLLGFTLSFAKKAKAAKEMALAARDSTKISLQQTEKAFDELKKQQIITEAKEREAFGDSYRDNGNMDEACANYQRAIDSITKYDYQTDTLYRKILIKLDKCK